MAVQDYELLLRVRADLNQALKGLEGLKRTMGKAGSEAAVLTRSGNAAAGSIDKLTNSWRALRSVIVAAGIAKLVQEYLNAADAMANLSARIGLVTTSEKNRAAVQQRLFDLAQRTGQQLGTTADLYVKLAQSSEYLRTHQTDLLRITESVGKAMALSGADTGTANGVVRQLAQSFASGVLRGDEFNSMMEGAPRLAQAFADGLGVPVGALRAMAAQGELTTDKLQAALLKQSQTIDSEFSHLPLTVSRATTQLKNSLQSLVGDSDNASDASRSVAESISGLAETMRSSEVKNGVAAIIVGLTNIASFAAKAASAIAGFGNAVADVFRADENKTYLGLLQERMRITEKITALESNPIAGRFGWNRGDVDELKKRLGEVDALLAARRAADQKKAAPTNDNTSGLENSNFLPTVTVHAPKATDADKAAAQAAIATARAAATAQQDLIKALVEVQAAADPVVAIYAKYNDQVNQANALAATAKRATGANVAAIDAQRDAIVQAYAVARDKDLAKLADADREAWKTLRESLRTPVEVHMEDAAQRVQQLNDLLAKGVITASEFHDAMGRVGKGSVVALPQYQGVDASVSGPMGELSKNFEAGANLDAAYNEQLAAADKFRAQDAANEEAYLAQKAELDRQYSEQKLKIEQGRQQLTLSASADFFGQLANLQHSSNNKIARIGKAAAIAQAIINTYQSATAAFAAMAGIPYIGPALGAAAAAVAIATGLANVAQIRAQPDSYDTGGYTGPGGRLEPAGIVHRGEVVWSQSDIRRAGGVGVVEALRLGYPPYADGGFVDGGSRAANSITPDFDGIAARQQTAAPNVQNNFRFISAFDANELAQRILETPAGEKAVVNHVIANSGAVKRGLQ